MRLLSMQSNEPMTIRTKLANATGRRALLIENAASLDYADLKMALVEHLSRQIDAYAQQKRLEGVGAQIYKRYMSKRRDNLAPHEDKKPGQEKFDDATWLETHKVLLVNSLAESLAYTANQYKGSNFKGLEAIYRTEETTNTEGGIDTQEIYGIKGAFEKMGSSVNKLYLNQEEGKKEINPLVLDFFRYACDHTNALHNIALPTTQQERYVNTQDFEFKKAPQDDATASEEQNTEEQKKYAAYLASSQGKLARKLDDLEKRLQAAITQLNLVDSHEPKVQALYNYIQNLKANLTTRLSIQPEPTDSRHVRATNRLLVNQADAIMNLLDARRLEPLIQDVAKIAKKRSDAEALKSALLKISPETPSDSKTEAKQSSPPLQMKLLTAEVISACIAEINAFNNVQSIVNNKISEAEKGSIIQGMLHAIAQQKNVTDNNMDTRVAVIAGQFAAKTAIALKQATPKVNNLLYPDSYRITKSTTEAVLEILNPNNLPAGKPLRDYAEETLNDQTKHKNIAASWNGSIEEKCKKDLQQNLTTFLKTNPKKLISDKINNLASTISTYVADKILQNKSKHFQYIIPVLIETMLNRHAPLSDVEISILTSAVYGVAKSINKSDSDSEDDFMPKITSALFEVIRIAKVNFSGIKEVEDDAIKYMKKNKDNLINMIVDKANINVRKENGYPEKRISDESREIYKNIGPIVVGRLGFYRDPEQFNDNSYQSQILEIAATSSSSKEKFDGTVAGTLSDAAPKKEDFEYIQENLAEAIEENQKINEDELTSRLILRQSHLTQFDPVLDSSSTFPDVRIGRQSVSDAHLEAGEYKGTKGKLSGINMTLDKKGELSYKPSVLSRLGWSITKKAEAESAVAMYFQNPNNVNKPTLLLTTVPSVSYVKSFVRVMIENFTPPKALVPKKITLSGSLEDKLKFLAHSKEIDFSKLTKEQKAIRSLLNKITKHNDGVDAFLKKRAKDYNTPNNTSVASESKRPAAPSLSSEPASDLAHTSTGKSIR